MDPCMRNDTWFPAMRFPFVLPNDIEFSGERKRVRCNEVLGCAFAGYLRDG